MARDLRSRPERLARLVLKRASVRTLRWREPKGEECETMTTKDDPMRFLCLLDELETRGSSQVGIRAPPGK